MQLVFVTWTVRDFRSIQLDFRHNLQSLGLGSLKSILLPLSVPLAKDDTVRSSVWIKDK